MCYDNRKIGASQKDWCRMNHRFVVSFLASVAICFAASLPTFAQKWETKAVWEGEKIISKSGSDPVRIKWLPDGDNVNINNEAFGSGSNSVSSSGAVTYTYTWNDEGTGIPAPDKVVIVITGGASAKSWKQFTSAPVQSPGMNLSFTASASASVPNTVTTRIPETQPQYPSEQEENVSQTTNVSWERISANGSFTKTINLSGSTSVNFAGNYGLCKANVSLSCGIGIHATPYNFRLVSGQTDPEANDLRFVYLYSSTTGRVSDLTSCTQHERVTYPGGDPYIPPRPFDAQIPNPTIKPDADDSSYQMTFGSIYDTHDQTPVAPFYCYASYAATQRYEYDDSFTGEKDILIPSTTGVNVNVITRTCEETIATTLGNWRTSVNKHGQTVWLIVGFSP